MAVTYTSNLEEVKVTLSRGYDRNIKKATVFLHGKVVKRLTGKRSGRKYLVPGTRKQYTASAPGESPATATGRLRSFDGTDFDILAGAVGRVGFKVKYGLWLERGTKKMAPRPTIKPAFDDNADEIQAIMSEPIK